MSLHLLKRDLLPKEAIVVLDFRGQNPKATTALTAMKLLALLLAHAGDKKAVKQSQSICVFAMLQVLRQLAFLHL